MSSKQDLEIKRIELLIKICDMIAEEARIKGDDRWIEPARQAEILKSKRENIINNSKPPPVTIQANVAIMGAKANGRG